MNVEVDLMEEVKSANEKAEKFHAQAAKLGQDVINAQVEISRLKGLLKAKNQKMSELNEAGGKNMDKEIIERLNVQIEFLSKRNAWLTDELSKGLSVSNERVAELIRKNEELSGMISSLNMQLESLHSERNELLRQLNEVSGKAQEQFHAEEPNTNQGAFNRLTTEANQLINQNATLEAESQILKEQIERLKADEDFLEESPEGVLALQQKVTELKIELSQLTSEKISAQYELDYLLQQKEKAGKEATNEEVLNLKRENEHLQQLLSSLTTKVEGMGHKLREYYIEVSAKHSKFDKFEQDCVLLENKLKKKSVQLEQARRDKTSLEERLSECLKQGGNEIYIKKLEAEAKSGREAIAFIRERLPSLSGELQELKAKMQNLEMENMSLKVAADEKKDLFHTTHMNAMQEPESEAREMNMERTLKRISELEDEIRIREKEAKALRKRVNEHEFMPIHKSRGNEMKLEKELQASKTREARLNKQVEQLKLLIVHMENANTELVKHIKKEQPESEAADALKKNLLVKSNELVLVNLNMSKTLEELQDIKAQLFLKATECEKHKSDLNSLNQQRQGELLEKDREIGKLRGDLVVVIKELNDLKGSIFSKEEETNLRETLEAANEENQRLNAELGKLGESQEMLKEITEQLQAKYEEVCEKLKEVGLERNSLAESYRLVCESNQRYSMDMEVLSNENKNLKEKIEELESNSMMLHEAKNQEVHSVTLKKPA
eukprot:TRINITY_DN8303_c0_g1_i8.p1 TRINITY_DN8303_c0_g1~~TRINITY_DN8303_c0_g1_i8.p1  ORF type:complete len:725 (+),score=234.34 TRINITY_DN8303_c0_g1_i8:610-2784(+)